MRRRFVRQVDAAEVAVAVAPAAKPVRRGRTGVLVAVAALVLGATTAAADQPGTVTHFAIP